MYLSGVDQEEVNKKYFREEQRAIIFIYIVMVILTGVVILTFLGF